MAIKTQQSLSGFIVGSLKLEHTKSGDAMLTARVGQERWEAVQDAPPKQLESEYFDIVQFRKAAERTFTQFKPGDRFVAEGYVRDFQYENRDGEMIPGQEFVVKKIGHDSARSRYTVDRAPRHDATGQDAPAQALTRDSAEQARESGMTADTEPSRTGPATDGTDRGRKLAEIPAGGVAATPERVGTGAEIRF